MSSSENKGEWKSAKGIMNVTNGAEKTEIVTLFLVLRTVSYVKFYALFRYPKKFFFRYVF